MLIKFIESISFYIVLRPPSLTLPSLSYPTLQSFDDGDYSAEVARRRSAQEALLGLFQFNKESDSISVKINADTGYTCKYLSSLFITAHSGS